jgi:type II secretory pathway component GspD/PulD (secretin)
LVLLSRLSRRRSRKQPAATPENAQPVAPATQATAAPAPTTNVTPSATSVATAVVTNDASVVATNAERPLHLNFRNAPLELVLKYLSEAAGFIILPETEVRGTIDVWSNQPLTKEEAVDVLNSVLKKNGYTAIRNGRSLKIISRAEAKTADVPVKSGNDPEDIPKNDEMVTQVIPVKHANAQQLIQNLGSVAAGVCARFVQRE